MHEAEWSALAQCTYKTLQTLAEPLAPYSALLTLFVLSHTVVLLFPSDVNRCMKPLYFKGFRRSITEVFFVHQDRTIPPDVRITIQAGAVDPPGARTTQSHAHASLPSPHDSSDAAVGGSEFRRPGEGARSEDKDQGIPRDGKQPTRVATGLGWT